MSTRIEPPAGHVVHSEQPVNSEPHPSQLIQSSSARGDTPADTLFLRNHSADIPLLDAETHAIALIDNVAAASDAPTRWIELDEKAVSVKELRDKYTSHDVSAVLECAGNRREEMSDRKQTEGVQWAQGTVGNVSWHGVLLSDVLRTWGIPPADDPVTEHLHVLFECDQPCQDDDYFGASIPLRTALDERAATLLALGMNGGPLAREHGAPVRVVVPGHIGARSVKWLHRIRVSTQESQCFYQQYDYKRLPPQVKPEDKTSVMPQVDPLQEYSMQCAICSPENDTQVSSGRKLSINGYALGTKGTPIAHVRVAFLSQVSANASQPALTEQAEQQGTWHDAKLLDKEEQSKEASQSPAEGRYFGWARWRAEVEVPDELRGSTCALVAYCEDEQGRRQPRVKEYNLRGVDENSWAWLKLSVT